MLQVVGVFYDISKPDEQSQPMNFRDALETMSFAVSLPFRYTSSHWCLKEGKKSSTINKSILEISTKLFSSYKRVRTQLHYGSDLELQYHLQSVGIPLKDFPVDSNGNLRQDIIDKWYNEEAGKCRNSQGPSELRNQTNLMASMTLNNSNTSSAAVSPQLVPILPNSLWNPNQMFLAQPAIAQPASLLTIQPTPQDILFGRGVGCQNHPGNIRFREIMESYKEQYDNVPRSKRRVIMSTLRHALQASGSRFLRFNKDGNWEECNAAEVDTKIGQFFRSLRKHKKEIGGT